MQYILLNVQNAKRSMYARLKIVLIQDGLHVEITGKFIRNFSSVVKGEESALFKHYFENYHAGIKK